MVPSTYIITLLFLLATISTVVHVVDAFTSPIMAPLSSSSSSSKNARVKFSTVILREKDFKESVGDGASNEEGKDLAAQFYKQMKGRENPPKVEDSYSIRKDNDLFSEMSSSSSNNTRKSSSSGSRNKDNNQFSAATPSPRKFTGGQSLFSEPASRRAATGGSSRSSSFGGSSSSSSRTTPTTTSRDDYARGRENEFALAGRFEQTIFLQAAAVLFSLIFVVGVGVTGGITDGSNRYYGGVDEIEEPLFGENYYTNSNINRDAIEIVVERPNPDSVWL